MRPNSLSHMKNAVTDARWLKVSSGPLAREEATVAMAQASSIPVIASGGITNIDDIRALKAVADQGICGAITGRAIYEGTLDVAEAQRLCDEAG